MAEAGRRAARRRRALGDRAEELAAERYAADGYVVEARQWQCAVGELDIVAARGEVIAFVEVRAVSTDYLESPTLTVSNTKQRRVGRAADAYLSSRATVPRDIRFDVVGVVFDGDDARFERLENAFTPGWAF